MLRKLSGIGVAVVTLFAASRIMAEDLGDPTFSFNGFGTLGAAHSSERNADFTSSLLKPNGTGASRNWSPDVDSRIAGQVTANLTPRLTAVLQVIAEQRYHKPYQPEVEWANIKYQLTPDFSVRAGRIALPIFLNADYRKVGYALAWARTPSELYSLIPVTHSDGVDASFRMRIGEVTNTIQTSYGKTDVKLSSDRAPKARDMWALSNTIEYGPASVRFSYLQTKLTVDYARPFFNAFRQFGPQGIAIADRYNLDSKLTTFTGLGAGYDPGNWFVMGEWGKSNTRSAVGKNSAWYVSGGYRIGSVTPYLTYARVRHDSNSSDPGLSVPNPFFFPREAAIATGLNKELNKFLGAAAAVQKTVSAGARWDFTENAALKLQYDRIDLGAGSQGLLINTRPGFERGGKVNVFSVVLDFVF